MKSPRPQKYVLAGVVGLIGLGVGATLGPTAASAATSTPAASAASSATSAVTSRVSALENALAGLVGDKTITQAQADKVATTLANKMPQGGGRGGADLDAAAKVIGVSTADLRTDLEGGKTLAQVAQTKGVSQATLVDALVTAAKTRIAADVTAGRLTQAQATTRTADLEARITERVTSTRPAGDGGRHGGYGAWGPAGSGSSSSPSSSVTSGAAS